MHIPSKKRQAVVFIHGIGEQHPITTLREFVEALTVQWKKDNPLSPELMKRKKMTKDERVGFWNKPDPESGNYETRKMTMGKGCNNPITDFYEFYWAHHMRNTNMSHIQDWLQRVVLRSPCTISPRLRLIFAFLWLIIAAVGYSSIIYISTHGIDAFSTNTLAIATSIGGSITLAFFSHFLFNYLGDAARYFDPSPENIEERINIRAEGIQLLTKLHKSNKYDRIIIVGHSLGSVIAYDLIKFLWSEYHKEFDAQQFETFRREGGRTGLNTIYASERYMQKTAEDKKTDDAFQQQQWQSHQYLKNIGNPWLITNVITIGSPLAHAGHLFVYKNQLFEKLKEQREYPTCPPRIQKPDTSSVIFSKLFRLPEIAHPFKLRYFNHSSPFAVTQWTNIYYSSDYIGGPLKKLFGNGIKDIRIKKGILNIYPCGHTKYWKTDNTKNVVPQIWKILKYQQLRDR